MTRHHANNILLAKFFSFDHDVRQWSHPLVEIWKSANIFIFIQKYVEDVILKQLLLFEICAWEICEKFVYIQKQ